MSYIFNAAGNETSDGMDVDTLMTEGSLNCLALHKVGLFAGGQDGRLRKIEVSQNKVRVVDTYAVGSAITSLSFNTLFDKLAVGSDMVRFLWSSSCHRHTSYIMKQFRNTVH